MIDTLEITNFFENVSFIISFHLLYNFSIRRNHHCQPNIMFKNNRRLLRNSARDIRLYELESHLQQTILFRYFQRLPTYSNYYFLNDSFFDRSFINVNQVQAACQAGRCPFVSSLLAEKC